MGERAEVECDGVSQEKDTRIKSKQRSVKADDRFTESRTGWWERVSKAENQGTQCTRCLFVQYSLPWSLKGNHK